MASMRHNSIQTGFTLIELIVVVLIIAVIAGATIMAFGPSFMDEKKETAALYEMTQIRDAILKFKRDNPTHLLTDTNLCSPADASFLFTDGYDTDNICDDLPEGTIKTWNPDYRTGWQGPYLTKLGNPTASSDGTIQFDGRVTSGTDLPGVKVITDPYGNPYYFFELDDDVSSLVREGVVEPRIVSMGADGVYNGLNCDPAETINTEPDYCNTENLCSSSSTSNDHVVCLK